MIILRSTGPVISTRRSSRSFGSGATVHSLSRICLRLLQKIRPLAGIQPLLPLMPRLEQLLPPRVERALQIHDKRDSLRR